MSNRTWSSNARPRINPQTGCLEFPFADGDAQEMHDAIMCGSWIRTIGLMHSEDLGYDVLTVVSVPHQRVRP